MSAQVFSGVMLFYPPEQVWYGKPGEKFDVVLASEYAAILKENGELRVSIKTQADDYRALQVETEALRERRIADYNNLALKVAGSTPSGGADAV